MAERLLSDEQMRLYLIDELNPFLGCEIERSDLIFSLKKAGAPSSIISHSIKFISDNLSDAVVTKRPVTLNVEKAVSILKNLKIEVTVNKPTQEKMIFSNPSRPVKLNYQLNQLMPQMIRL